MSRAWPLALMVAIAAACGSSHGNGTGPSGIGGGNTGGSSAGSSGAGGDSGGGAAGSCAISATQVELASGSWSFSGDTAVGVDDFPELTCESQNVAGSLAEKQIYFRFQAQAGQAFEFTLTPTFYGFLYVFPLSAACDGVAIQEACSSDGESGMISQIVNPGAPISSSFEPATPGAYVFAVDSDTSTGPFELTVTAR